MAKKIPFFTTKICVILLLIENNPPAGIQTEVKPQLGGQQEHNKAVLASQENEMKECVKRQQVRSSILDDRILFKTH